MFNPKSQFKMENSWGGALSYVCPHTHERLRLAEGGFLAEGSRRRYPLHGDIPDFLSFPPAEDLATKSQLVELNRLARDEGWRPALDTVYCKTPAMVRYVTDSRRAAFVDLLPLSRTSDVLEIGPGLGQLTGILSRRAASVSALEVVAGQAEFARERCRQDGLTNVRFAVGGDDCRLPYGDAAFDLVVLNLVFEWCASRCTGESHRAAQLRLLDQIARVLKPGGSLFLATKNRFSLHYLIGKKDEHLFNMRFGSALPRWLAALVLRMRGHGRPPGMLHSHNALRAMLRTAGLGELQSFWAAPEMRFPARIVPNEVAAIRTARKDPTLVQGEYRSTRVLMRFVPAALVRHCSQGLVVLATKPK